MRSTEPATVAVLGAGLMGSSIATAMLRTGSRVHLYDVCEETAQQAMTVLDCADRLSACATVKEAVEGSHVIFEAVAEDLGVKRQLYAEVQRHNQSAPIASNTSTFMPSSLSMGLEDPGRLLVAHFFNPADTVPLVEIVRSASTRTSAADAVMQLLERAGKRPVLLNGEAPGFVANRLQAAVLSEALSVVRQGVATIEQVDEVVTTGLGPRWSVAGPFTVADLGGLDVFTALADRLFPVLDSADCAPNEMRRLVAQGDLGAKTGGGFHRHPADTWSALQASVRASFGRFRNRSEEV